MPQVPAIQWGVIAGIRDHGGGRRVVHSTNPFSIPANTMFHKGERYFPVPGMHRMGVWEHYPWIVWKGEQAVLDADPARGDCGSCRACCITLFIADDGDGFTKPSHTPCGHLCNAGCNIYDKRPRTCSAFKCVWLKSQDGNRPMVPELRPDRCGAILTDHDDGPVRVHVDQSYPRSPALDAFIAERTAEGESFDQVTHYYGEAR